MDKNDIMETPQILLFDCDRNIKSALEQHKYNLTLASFGSDMKVNHDIQQNTYVNYNDSVPLNIHEFDVFIIDMNGAKEELINTLNPAVSDSYVFEIEFPEKFFYTSTLSSKYMFNKVKKGIYIIFASASITKQYSRYKVTKYGLRDEHSFLGCPYDYLSNIIDYSIDHSNKIGEKTKLLNIEIKLSNVLNKYNSRFRYCTRFLHPTYYDTDSSESIKRDNFIPLIVNNEEEIISFLYFDDNNILIMLPQIKKKDDILIDILNNYLTQIAPEMFSFFTQFDWLNDKYYMLPRERDFFDKIQELEIEHNERVHDVKENIKKNKKQFKFLHDILTETDSSLVSAIIKYLKWIGFNKVINVDKETGELKEDIKVYDENNLLIIEVKGIGGTSTDSNCSQISKHRRKNEKENKGFGVIPLYIVNHQRYLPPQSRNNPPFTDEQIDYAKNDERGLVTTFQLYKWYYMHEKGILTKEEIKNQLVTYGNIALLPENYTSLGKIDEYFSKNNAFILNLEDTEISIGDKLIFIKENDWLISEITSIQVNDKPKQKAHKGEVGLVVEKTLSRGYEVYLKKEN